ncbi:hypothetical protein KGF57_003938 [Candida theae]|uniref:Uncharacterized protein n=1 Tax=Candida theae TaxID=1198502 RepID=A0AAD5BC23_9ASCO|nr:uncharacterized protein KGF57_003938 [Candida theae]KAI5953729.1 hypothetical protein KGF57_003938 [Candida theae]
MTPHSRRNSITSVSTANTYSSQHKSLSRDMSTDNLLSVDSKFMKKPAKRVTGSMPSPTLAARESYSKSNSITSSTSYNSFSSHNSYAPNNAANGNRVYNPPSNHNNAIPPSNGYRNMGAPPGSYYTKEGVYYFPNGEVFRPRTAPAKRNRPGKISIDTSAKQNSNNANYNNSNSNSNSNSNPNSLNMGHGYHNNPNHNAPSMGPQMNQSRFPNESPTNSPAISAPPTLRSTGSYTSIPKSNSLQNVRLANKQTLSKSIRENKGDIQTNISFDNNINGKMPYENYRNNSTTSLRNLQRLQPQNITRCEHHHSSNPSSSVSSINSNMSNVLHNQYNNNSAANLCRSDSNTPSTSISDEQIHQSFHQLSNAHTQKENNIDELETDSDGHFTATGSEYPQSQTIRQTPNTQEPYLENVEATHSGSYHHEHNSQPRVIQHSTTSDTKNATNRESSGSSDQMHSMDSTSSNNGGAHEDDVTDDTVVSTLNANSDDTFKTATAVSTLRSNSAGHSMSSIGDNLNRQHVSYTHGNTSPHDLQFKEYSGEPLVQSSSSVSEVSLDEDEKNAAETSQILSEPRDMRRDASQQCNGEATETYISPEKPVLANISDMSFNSTQEELTKSGATTPVEQAEWILPESDDENSLPGSPGITIPINCSVLESRVENAPDSKSPSQLLSLAKSRSIDRENDIAGFPEPSVNAMDESHADDYSPESYELNALIETHNQESPVTNIQQTPQSQASITGHTVNVPEAADKLNQQVLSPTYSFSSVPSADFEITSKPFNRWVNDSQKEVPPRGDVQIVGQKIRKHHRQASSTSSAEYINQIKQGAASTPSAMKRSPTKAVELPETPKVGRGRGAHDDIETPPHDAVPPPPIEKSPDMKVKGKPKKHGHSHHHHQQGDEHKKEDDGTTNSKSDDVKNGSTLKEEVVFTPPQPSQFPKTRSLLPNDSGEKKSSLNHNEANPTKSTIAQSEPVFNKPAPMFRNMPQPQPQPQPQSPQQSVSSIFQSPNASVLSHSTFIGSTQPSKLGKSSSVTNFKTFFKKLKPKDKDGSDSANSTSTSLRSGGSSLSLSSKKKSNRGLFGLFKKDETSSSSLLAKPPAHKDMHDASDGNRLSVLSEASFKLGSLPDFEPESAGLFDDVMLSFDEKFERDLTPTKPPDFAKLPKTMSKSKNGVLSEPFLKDDELTREQIDDQKLRDEADNAGDEDGSSGDNAEGDVGFQDVETEPSGPIAPPTASTGGNDENADNDNTGTWTGTYIDENIEFLKNEGFWSQLDESALARQIELEKRSSGIAPRPSSKPEDIATSSPIIEEAVTGEERIISREPPQNQFEPTSPLTSNVSATVVVNRDELNSVLVDLSEDGKRNLPVHLKYIKQFRDYPSIEVEVHKFEPVVPFVPRDELVARNNSPSILKRGRSQLSPPYGYPRHHQQSQQSQSPRSQHKLQMPASFPPQDQHPPPPSHVLKRVNFNNKIQINETFSSDVYKRYNKSVTQYSLSDPKEISNIKNEVNYYKCNEMLVHESSQNNTHFYY